MTTEAAESTEDKVERDRLMSQAYGVAAKRLREAHQQEFNGYYAEECKVRGIDWTPRKSKEETALDQIQELLGQFPDLAEKLAKRLANTG